MKEKNIEPASWQDGRPLKFHACSARKKNFCTKVRNNQLNDKYSD